MQCGSSKGTCIDNAHCQFSQLAHTNYGTYLHCQCIFSIFSAGANQLKCKHTCIKKRKPCFFINNKFALQNVEIFSYFINQFVLENVGKFRVKSSCVHQGLDPDGNRFFLKYHLNSHQIQFTLTIS